MLELLTLVGTPPPPGIALETTKGWAIPNSKAPPSPATAQADFLRLFATHPAWRLRKLACGQYNCAGLVWATRRTAIYDTAAFWRILQDDGCRQTKDGEPALPGDLALYCEKGQAHHITHIGQVIWTDRADGIDFTQTWFLSKPNDTFGEFIHPAMDYMDFDCLDLTYWTDRA